MMGLDIYVQWDDMTSEEKDAQITGFSDAPQYGYLRASWGNYALLEDTSKRLDHVLPLVGYHKYAEAGMNDGMVKVTQEVMDELRHWRTLWQVSVVSIQTNDAEDFGFCNEHECDYYARKLSSAAEMVDFIEAKFNEGKTGLTVCYS